MKRCILLAMVMLVGATSGGLSQAAQPAPAPTGAIASGSNLWELARQYQSIHRFATLFTAQDVRDYLSTEKGRQQAIDWCQATAVSHVYLETYRDRYQAERESLREAKTQFEKLGFLVSGCVTTTQIGKASTGWKASISCYTDQSTQDKLQAIFEFAASLFDEIMIDDFWFTDCACTNCDAARQAKIVTIGSQPFPVTGDSWTDYRGELMSRLSQNRILAPARRLNPKVKIIIKYPQWYDRFHERGYDVARETADFDRIWVGTETRDYRDKNWGGTVPYEAYFIMRWLGGIGGAKCGGGWYDWLGTTASTYVEQARQTILAGARESLLFCYGGLQKTTGPANVRALRQNLPELFQVAKAAASRQPMGLAAYKPVNSPPETEARVFDFVGMLGLPLVPCHQFPTDAPAAFFSIHALKDPDFPPQLLKFIQAGKPVLLTDGLAKRLDNTIPVHATNVQILSVQGKPALLLEMGAEQLATLRQPLLKPFKLGFQAPNQVAFYAFTDGSWVMENFNDLPVRTELNGIPYTLPARGWQCHWTTSSP